MYLPCSIENIHSESMVEGYPPVLRGTSFLLLLKNEPWALSGIGSSENAVVLGAATPAMLDMDMDPFTPL